MQVTIDVDYNHELGDLLWGKAYHVYKGECYYEKSKRTVHSNDEQF